MDYGQTPDVPQDVLVTIQKFYSCEPGTFPDDVSDEDWSRLLEYGGDAATELFYYIAQHATPGEERVTITDEEFDELTMDSSAPYKSTHAPVSYDPQTDEVTVEDVSHIDELVAQLEPIESNSQDNPDYDQEPEIEPNEYPYTWFEPNPQNFFNTRTTFKLIYRSEGALWVGSAFKINSKSLATAGHNLYTPGDGWSQDMVIIPSWRPTNPKEPYGRAQWVQSTVGGNWAAKGDVNDDWGIITVRTANIVPGRLTLRRVGSSSLNGQWTRGHGYLGRNGGDIYMHLVAGNVTSTGRRMVRVQRKYVKGMSGGPVIDRNDRIIGIVNNEKGFIKLDDWIYTYFSQQP